MLDEAAAKIIEISGGTVAGFIFVINLFDLPGNNLLKDKGYKTESLNAITMFNSSIDDQYLYPELVNWLNTTINFRPTKLYIN